MEEHDHLGFALNLGNGASAQLLMVDKASKAGPGVKTSNHGEDGQDRSMCHHISDKLRREKYIE